MKSKFMRLDQKDGIKIALNMAIGSILTAILGSVQAGGFPSFQDLYTIITVGVIAGLTSLSRRLLTNSDDTFATTEVKIDVPEVPAKPLSMTRAATAFLINHDTQRR